MAATAESESIKHFVWCCYCGRSVNATHMGEVIDHDYDHGPASCVSLLRCDACGQALVVIQEESQDYGESFKWDEMVRVWPDGLRPLSTAVPEALRKEHQESRKCLDAKAYTAVVVMVRRTLEGVCALHGIRERDLYRSLRKMRDGELIDHRLLEWAEALRVLGNEGAHFTGEQVSREDAADALALSEALLDYLYVLSAKFQEFQERRKARKNGDSGGGQQSKTV